MWIIELFAKDRQADGQEGSDVYPMCIWDGKVRKFTEQNMLKRGAVGAQKFALDHVEEGRFGDSVPPDCTEVRHSIAALAFL